MSEHIKYDLIYIPTNETVFHEESSAMIAEMLNMSAKKLGVKVARSENNEAVFGEYLVKRYANNESNKTAISHKSTSELVTEFMRVCREPKLWKTIDDTCLGDWYINDKNKAVLAHETV